MSLRKVGNRTSSQKGALALAHEMVEGFRNAREWRRTGGGVIALYEATAAYDGMNGIMGSNK